MDYWKGMVLGLVLVISQTALADFRTITRAHEISLSDFRAPASVNGIVSFKLCESCEMQTVNVTTATQYILNTRSVALPKFRKSLSSVQDQSRETVTVLHHLESDVITSISVSL